jgi:UDP-N-acetylmuramate dehydrogenase
MLKIQENLDLKDFSSLKLGNGKVAKFYEIENLEDFSKLEEVENIENLLVLGSGANTVFVNNNLNKNILKINFNDIEVGEKIKVGAGVDWDTFVLKYLELGGVGMESLSYIPGTVGAAPIQNIGAYGHDVSEFIHSIIVYDKEDKTIKELSHQDCDFSYRNSRFKKEPNRFIILYVVFNLLKGEVSVPKYKDILNYLNNKENISNASDLWKNSPTEVDKKFTASEIRDAVISVRKMKFPDIKEIPNCGSFFENPIINREQLKKIQEKLPEIPVFPTDNMKTEGEAGEFVKIPLAYILEKMNLKGKRIGNFSMFENHALILTKRGEGNVDELKSFIEYIKKEVKENFGIDIKEEVNLL